MGIVLIKTNIKRDRTKLYYCGTDNEGYLTLCEAKMARGGGKKKTLKNIVDEKEEISKDSVVEDEEYEL